jgi:hypothetical protein
MGRQCGQTIVVEDLDDAFVGRDVQLKVFDQQKQSRHIKKWNKGGSLESWPAREGRAIAFLPNGGSA